MSLFSLLSQSVHNLVPCPSGVVMLMLFCGQHQMIPVSDCLLVAEIILKLVAKLLLKAVGASCLGCPLMLCDFLLYLEIRTLDLETNLCLSRGNVVKPFRAAPDGRGGTWGLPSTPAAK